MKKTFKKATVAVAALSLAVSAVPTTTFPQSAITVKASIDGQTFEGGDLKYEVIGNNTQVKILGFKDNATDLTTLTIPATVNFDDYDFPVTSITDEAFKDCTTLTKLVFTDKDGKESNTTNLTTIGSNAFEGCTGLTTLTLAEGITTLESNTFLDCTNLTTINFPATFTTVKESWNDNSPLNNCTKLEKVTFAEGATIIPNHIFSKCDFITNAHFSIPSTITTIGESAFRGLTKLDSFAFPEHLEKIGQHAFDGCTGLTSIQLPETVTTLGSHSFKNCTGLTKVTVPKSVTTIDTDVYDQSPFTECANLTEVVFQDGMVNIPDFILNGASSVKEITIPDSVTSIGNSAFKKLGQLKNITLPKNLTTIGQNVFYDCSSLSSITFPETLTTLGSNSFHTCNRLTEVTVPKSVTTIDTDVYDQSPFTACENLTKVVFEDGIVEIPEFMLNGASSVKEITIPDSVTTIGNSAFKKLDKLENITLPKNLTTIKKNAFYECSSISSITFPETLTTLGSNSFHACKYLTEVTLPKSLTTIDTDVYDQSPFVACEKLEKVTFQEGAVKVPNYILKEVTSVKQVVIPSSVTSIEDVAFKNITKNITIYGYTNSCAETYAKKYEIPFVSTGVAEPVATEPVATEPVATEPVATEPAATEPAPTATTPAATEPAPTATTPAATEPAPTATTPVATEPAPTATAPVKTEAPKKTAAPTKAPVKAPAKVTISSVKRNSSKKATVKWKKISGVAGYQVTYAVKSNFKGAKTKDVSKNKISYTITDLKKGTVYYVKVRAYKKDSKGKKVLGKYSTVKKIKK